MHELTEGEIDLEISWQNFDYNAVGQNGDNDKGSRHVRKVQFFQHCSKGL